VNRRQQALIEYLRAENQSPREQLGNRRIRWTDAQRRRLAEKAKVVGRSALASLGPVVTANTNSGEGRVRRRERVGGVMSYYYRHAA